MLHFNSICLRVVGGGTIYNWKVCCRLSRLFPRLFEYGIQFNVAPAQKYANLFYQKLKHKHRAQAQSTNVCLLALSKVNRRVAWRLAAQKPNQIGNLVIFSPLRLTWPKGTTNFRLHNLESTHTGISGWGSLLFLVIKYFPKLNSSKYLI